MTPSVEDTKTIYDLGANNGDDIEYYLKKGDKVVAVEANPSLCKIISKKFVNELNLGKLVIENCAVTTDRTASDVDFYLSKNSNLNSQLHIPDRADQFEKIRVPSKSIIDLIENHGIPHYIKIDIEGSDKFVLRQLFEHEFKPPFISVEAHTAEIFAILLALGEYRSFQLVEGSTVSKKYKNHKIRTNGGIEMYSFPSHSAGPFGQDIDGNWMNPEDFCRFLGLSNFGWKDIHATTEILPVPKVFTWNSKPTIRMRAGRLRRKILSKIWNRPHSETN